MKIPSIFPILFIFFCSYLSGQDWTRSLLNEDCMASGSASIAIRDLDRNQIILSHDSHRALPTASIQKILPTAASLKLLGKDFRYLTQVGYSGSIRAGVLQGDLIVQGSGDPSLGSPYFEKEPSLEQWLDTVVKSLRQQKIQTIKGNIVLDISHISGQNVPSGWPWADLGNYYGAGHWAINFHNNEYKLYFKQNPHLGGATQIIATSPSLKEFELKNEVYSGPAHSGDQSYIFAAPNGQSGVVRGSIPLGTGSFSIRGSIPNPPQALGGLIAEVLKENGIEFSGAIISSQEKQKFTAVLHTHPSPTLEEIARVTNFKSVNLYAEALLKLLCQQENSPSSFDCGLKTLMDFYYALGINTEQSFIVDGSGLSPRNAASAGFFTEVLQKIYDDKPWFNSFITTLPEMGKEGTVQSMMRGQNTALIIKAKSGFIGRQRSYSGYIFTPKKKVYSFCIILDNYSCSSSKMRSRIEDVLGHLTQYLTN